MPSTDLNPKPAQDSEPKVLERSFVGAIGHLVLRADGSNSNVPPTKELPTSLEPQDAAVPVKELPTLITSSEPQTAAVPHPEPVPVKEHER